jgi:hypothetical protein
MRAALLEVQRILRERGLPENDPVSTELWDAVLARILRMTLKGSDVNFGRAMRIWRDVENRRVDILRIESDLLKTYATVMARNGETVAGEAAASEATTEAVQARVAEALSGLRERLNHAEIRASQVVIAETPAARPFG